MRNHPAWILKSSSKLTLPPYTIPLELNSYSPTFHSSIVQLLSEQGFKLKNFDVTTATAVWKEGCVIGSSECPYDRQLDVEIVSIKLVNSIRIFAGLKL